MAKKTSRSARQPSGGSHDNTQGRTAAGGSPATHAAVPSMVVGIGASAGGLEAFRTFFAHMPADSDFAFVVVQHLSTSHTSALAELLGRSTDMLVVEATDGMRVEPRHVYVIPVDATLTIVKGMLNVEKPAPPRALRWPVNAFFASLADDMGERAACIVLSGLGSDGAKGLRAIKDHGGLTLAQSEFDHVAMSGMPASAASTGLVDDVLPVQDMPARLQAYWTHLQASRNVQDAEGIRQDLVSHLQTLFRSLRDEVGHDFSRYKQTTLLRRLQRRMLVCQTETVPEYLAYLKKKPEENYRLFQEMLISVTEFFRDTAAFRALEQRGVPALLDGKTAADVIRVWVPGCATGEEAYSIAMLLAEAIGDRSGPRVQIFATDIDEHAIGNARAGRFLAPIQGVSSARLERWFRKDGDDYCVIKRIREMCVFSPHSVIKDPPFSNLDLISCRNLLIYLNTELQDRLFLTFSYALKTGGLLFIGPSENLGRRSGHFDEIDNKHRLYRRRPPSADHQGLTFPLAGAGVAAAMIQGAPTTARSASETIERNVRRLLEKYSPAYVLLNTKNDVLRFAGDTGRYLSPSSGTASLNVFGLLHRRLREPARALLGEAFANAVPVVKEGIRVEIHGRKRVIRLIAEPLVDEAGDASMCVLAFDETAVPTAVSAEPAASSSSDTPRIQELQHELDLAHIQLQTALELHETASEDLKSANEEYQSVNEELQSVNEELETSKEEMQSINEELQIVNAEITSKNEALGRLNNDLVNLMDSTQVATLFLDAEMRIGTYTPALKNLFHLRDGDRGRPIQDIASKVSYHELPRDFRKMQRRQQVLERILISEKDGSEYLTRMRPYVTAEGIVNGVVLTFFDVTENRRKEAEREKLAAIVDSSRDAVIGYGLDDTIISWNQSAERMFGYSAAWAIGKPLSALLPAAADETARAVFAPGGSRLEEFEAVWSQRDGKDVPVAVTNSPVYSKGRKVVSGSLVARDISERREAERHGAMLLGELNHRVKNTLASIQAIALQTINHSETMRDFQNNFLSRLQALSKTHNLLSEEAWKGVDLSSLVENEAAPFQDAGKPARVRWHGSDLQLIPKAALALGMTLHELTTNAVKYGALSGPEGYVEVTSEIGRVDDSDRLAIVWEELNGPPVHAPTRRGFGSRLISGGIVFELDGVVSLEFLPTGVRCEIDIPLESCCE